jgi:hypothetical protein
MASPLYGASSAYPGAEQRGTKVVGALEVCSKALQQRDGLLGTTRCHVPGFAHNFGLHPWIADGRDGQCDWAFKHQNR